MQNAKCKMEKDGGRPLLLMACFAFLHSAFCISHSSFAQTTQPTLTADLGFGGVFRPDSWAPVFVTVADTSSRSGTIEIRTARGRVGNVVAARMQSNARPTTFTLYAPLDPLDHAVVEWRDGAGRIVSSLDLSEKARENPAALGGPVVGVAGAIAEANRVVTQLTRDTGEFVAAGAIPTRLLPERSAGYHALDVLVLPELNADEIDDAVETEIVKWVRGGGLLVTWPGALAPAEGSPLADVLPATVGDIAVRTIGGREVSVRSLTANGRDAVDQSDSDSILFTRKIGLGQVAVFGFDPTQVYGSVDRRIEAFRDATAGQIALSADERRVGSFDALLHQARGEEQLPARERGNHPWLWLALALGLVAGPGEILLLMLCRRQIFTPVTLAGLGVALGAGLGLGLSSQAVDDARVDVVIEDDAGTLVRASLAANVEPPTTASWLIGRSTDPLHDTAGELSLRQRQEGLEAAGAMIALSDRVPRVRSLEFGSGKPKLLVSGSIDASAAQVQSADDVAWERAAVLSQESVALLSKAPGADAAMDVAGARREPTAADEPGTVRRETAIEALARLPGWEPILMDRHLAARLVKLFEAENLSAVATMRTRGATKEFVVHVQRR